MSLTKEQLTAVNHEQGDIIVSASAGSGKTHVMISRVIRLITQKRIPVDSVAVLTFTEAAAAEMKEKLKQALIDKINESENDEFLENQLSLVSVADISTIHSFCSRLLRTYFFEVGIAPDYKILEDKAVLPMKERAMESALSEMLGSGDETFKKVLKRHAHKRKLGEFKKLVGDIYKFIQFKAEPETLLDRSVENYEEDNFKKLLSECESLIMAKSKSAEEKFEKLTVNAEKDGYFKSAEYLRYLTAETRKAIDVGVYGLKDLDDLFSRKANFDKGADACKKAATDCRDDLKDAVKKYSKIFINKEQDLNDLAALKEHTAVLIETVKKFSARYEEQKKDANGLDFNDLEHLTVKLLKNDAVKSAVRSKYRYVFVDEYQDVNDAQETIIRAVSDKNLFMVGDEKQCIYGFRGCTPDAFRERFDSADKSGCAAVRLNANFRSAKAVVNAVNKVFDFCMTDKIYGNDYACNSRLIYGGVYDDGGEGKVVAYRINASPRTAATATAEPVLYDVPDEIALGMDEEIKAVSALIYGIVKDETEGGKYYDFKSKTYKPVTFKDIAVLTRDRSGSQARSIVRGLSLHGIPVSSVAEDNILSYPEIKTMIWLLRLIVCFDDSVALATVMKSPVGKFSDEELKIISDTYRDKAQHGKKRRFADAYLFALSCPDIPEELSVKLKKFDEYMGEVRFLADFKSAGEILKKVADDFSLEGYLYASIGGEDKARRLRRFISAGASRGEAFGVADFLELVEKDDGKITITGGGDEDSVTVMTMHASKGLEFPVVIVCGLEKPFSGKDLAKEVLFDKEYGIAVRKYIDAEGVFKETPLRVLYRERIKRETLKEEARLFYVALTRAKYSLYMTFIGKEDDREEEFSGANRCWDFIPDNFPVTVVEEDEIETLLVKEKIPNIIIAEKNADDIEKMKGKLDFAYPFENDTVLPLKTSVTDVTRDNAGVYRITDEEIKYAFDKTNETGTERGVIAHRFMENLDFTRLFDLAGEKERMQKSGIITEEEFALINFDKLCRAIQSPVFSALSEKSLYREKSFLVAVPPEKINKTGNADIVLQGVIDLLAIDGDYAEIIDYKYSSFKGEALKAKYAMQLDLYAYAVEKVLNKKVKKKILFNLLSGEIAETD